MASGFLPSSTLCHPPASIASVSSSSGWAGRREACLGKKATDFCRFGNSWLHHTIYIQTWNYKVTVDLKNGECLTGSFFTLLPSSVKAESPLRQRRHSLQQPSPVFRTLSNIWTQNWKTSLPWRCGQPCPCRCHRGSRRRRESEISCEATRTLDFFVCFPTCSLKGMRTAR